MADPVAPATILLVDDEPEIREVLEEALGDLGYRVHTARSADAALAIAEAETPDVVLTDVHLGGVTGVELCARLKENPRFHLTPVILLTGVSDLPSRIAGLAAGADDFFAKPCDLVELRTRIASLVRLKRLQDELQAKNALLRTLLGRYVSEAVAAEVLASPEKHLRVGGETRTVTILFADLRGFTPVAETLEAADVVEILNTYLGRVVDVVFAHGGTLDKFRGDGVMAIFGAPVAHDDDPARAVRCAVELHAAMTRITFDRFPDLQLHLGIGINTGPVIAGTIGSDRRMDYTVVGHEVNVAARFEASAGPGQTLITGRTYEEVKPLVDVRDLGRLRVKGTGAGVPAFDVLALR
jgi:adenylate cyclase